MKRNEANDDSTGCKFTTVHWVLIGLAVLTVVVLVIVFSLPKSKKTDGRQQNVTDVPSGAVPAGSKGACCGVSTWEHAVLALKKYAYPLLAALIFGGCWFVYSVYYPGEAITNTRVSQNGLVPDTRVLQNGSVPDPSTLQKIGLEALQYTNEYRQKNGLEPLRWNQKIADVSRGHSQDMCHGRVGSRHVKHSLTHDGFENRVDEFPQGYRGAAENVGMRWGHGYNANTIARKQVDGWIASPGHRKNMVGDYTDCGISVYHCPQGWYSTQMFGRY